MSRKRTILREDYQAFIKLSIIVAIILALIIIGSFTGDFTFTGMFF